MSKKNNIILTGMPGAGKSTIGVVLAKIMGLDFCDTDLIIQKNEKRTLQNIIDNDGLDAFLLAERAAILQLDVDGCVIATGGSVVLQEDVMARLRSLGVVVYLRASYEQITKRIHNLNARGIAFEKGQTLLDIYNQRTPMYERFCDVYVDCDDFDCALVCEKIKSALTDL